MAQFQTLLESNRTSLASMAEQRAANRMRAVALTLEWMHTNADILRFETAKARGDLKGARRFLGQTAARLPDGAALKAELLFELALLDRDLGDEASAVKGLQLILRDYPAYERRQEVTEFLIPKG